MARIAAVQGEFPRALEYMQHAFASLENHDLPSVAWRLHATAAQLQIQLQDFEASERHCLESASSLNRAAASFGGNDPLRRSLMSAAESLKTSLQNELEVARASGARKPR
jgi:hypothetical protein